MNCTVKISNERYEAQRNLVVVEHSGSLDDLPHKAIEAIVNSDNHSLSDLDAEQWIVIVDDEVVSIEYCPPYEISGKTAQHRQPEKDNAIHQIASQIDDEWDSLEESSQHIERYTKDSYTLKIENTSRYEISLHHPEGADTKYKESVLVDLSRDTVEDAGKAVSVLSADPKRFLPNAATRFT